MWNAVLPWNICRRCHFSYVLANIQPCPNRFVCDEFGNSMDGKDLQVDTAPWIPLGRFPVSLAVIALFSGICILIPIRRNRGSRPPIGLRVSSATPLFCWWCSLMGFRTQISDLTYSVVLIENAKTGEPEVSEETRK